MQFSKIDIWYQKRIQENKKKSKGVDDCRPINILEQEKKFFKMNFQYNPQFIYKDYNATAKMRTTYNVPHNGLLSKAVFILEQCLMMHGGSEQKFVQKDGGKLLSKEVTLEYFQQYLTTLDLQDSVRIVFDEKAIAPTAVVHCEGYTTIVISVPIHYREKRIQGVMNHEIGTHLLRKLNDRKQQWYKNRRAFNLKPYICTEEGLASIHQVIDSASDPNRLPFM